LEIGSGNGIISPVETDEPKKQIEDRFLPGTDAPEAAGAADKR